MYRCVLKRVVDVFLALCALLVIWPLLLIVVICLYFTNKRSGVFFTQVRIGKGERSFKIFKFKSMTDDKDEKGELLPDAKRLTKVGRFIRSSSIDELPQLLNILKGDMSFIGPRPLPPIYLPYYTKEEAHRHDVRPGITGLAQVNGRKNITWDHKLRYDVFYVRNLSFKLDMKIFFITIKKVLKRDGVGVDTSGQVSLYDTRRVQRHKSEA